MKKLTVIWNKRWQSGSHWHCLTKCSRVITNDQTLKDQLEGMDIYDVQYIFEGWPNDLGDESEVVEGTT